MCDTVRAIPNFAKNGPTLVETSVICLSSVVHHLGSTDWEGAAGGHRGRTGGSTYADSKLAMVLLAKVRISLIFFFFEKCIMFKRINVYCLTR